MNPTFRSVDYDQVAPSYDGRYQRSRYAEIEQALLQFIGTAPKLRILEVGCGTGHWLKILRARGQQVTGLDFSAGMLARAQTSLAGIRLIRGQAECLPVPDASFDRVFCINAFHHFADKCAFLAEARRVLRPGGKIFIVGIDPHQALGQWYVYDYFPESLSIDKQRYPASRLIRQWMNAAGFERCVTREVEHWRLQVPARQALAQGSLDKAVTSQLTVLTEEEYRRGIQQLQEDLEHAEAQKETLLLRVDLRVYGTSGSVPASPQGTA